MDQRSQLGIVTVADRSRYLAGCFAVIASLVWALLLTGCSAPTNSNRPVDPEDEANEIKALIEELSHYRSVDDLDSEETYRNAVFELTMRGSAAEPLLVDALATSDDWGIRYGALEVLDSVGTNRSVETLIGRLNDAEPQVALKALFTVRAITAHSEVPLEGIAPSGLPAIPQRAPDDYEPDTEIRNWTAWHAQHGALLQATWQSWWASPENREAVRDIVVPAGTEAPGS